MRQVIAKAEAATDLATCLGALVSLFAISWALRPAKRFSNVSTVFNCQYLSIMQFGCPIGPRCPQMLGLVFYVFFNVLLDGPSGRSSHPCRCKAAQCQCPNPHRQVPLPQVTQASAKEQLGIISVTDVRTAAAHKQFPGDVSFFDKSIQACCCFQC